MTFRVGQKVICIKPGRHGLRWAGRANCIVGKVYTVRSIYLDDEWCLLVDEIINPSFFDGGECGFYADRFRPIVERKTDISCLKALLVPGAKIRETA